MLGLRRWRCGVPRGLTLITSVLLLLGATRVASAQTTVTALTGLSFGTIISGTTTTIASSSPSAMSFRIRANVGSAWACRSHCPRHSPASAGWHDAGVVLQHLRVVSGQQCQSCRSSAVQSECGAIGFAALGVVRCVCLGRRIDVAATQSARGQLYGDGGAHHRRDPLRPTCGPCIGRASRGR